MIVEYEKYFGKAIFNRHHYFRNIFPDYIEKLENSNIKEDFSIIFLGSDLFRCGLSSSFRPWNSYDEKSFKIKITPTTLMDGTFTDYLKCNKNEAYEIAVKKLDLAFRYGSSIVLLWHNRSFVDKENNYHINLYESLINYIEKKIT